MPVWHHEYCCSPQGSECQWRAVKQSASRLGVRRVPTCASLQIVEVDMAAASVQADTVVVWVAVSVAGIPAETPESPPADMAAEMEKAAVMAWPRTATAA